MLRVRNLRKAFLDRSRGSHARVQAVDDVSITVEDGQFYTLLGPSGCGKTTTLRMVAGLEEPDAGEIVVDGRILNSGRRRINVPPHKRGFGMVFQSYAIWPNMTVGQNIKFALRGRRSGGGKRLTGKEMAERIERSLELVDLAHLVDRPATKLSGGQQQRLALARALAVEPPLLLLDEPLSNLDLKLRERMRLGLKRMQRDLGVTTLYVTHDQLEAMAMSTTVAVMNKGRIEQAGRPQEVYNEPATRFVAEFVGQMNFLRGSVTDTDGPGACVRTPQGDLVVRSRPAAETGRDVTVSIRPENVLLRTEAANQPGPNQWRGKVEAVEYLGEAADYRVAVGDAVLLVRSEMSDSLGPGGEVIVELPPDDCALIVDS